MLYSTNDIQTVRRQLLRRITVMVALAVLPNILAGVVMYTVRIQWLSIALGCLGGALAIFYWGICGYPISAYLRFVREIVGGRTHEFTGSLKSVAEDSVREGVPCKTLYFSDDAGDDERLCYFDLQKFPAKGFIEKSRYRVIVHGQAIVDFQPES